MPNPYYDHTTYPTPNAPGSSAQLRAELDLIEAGFDKLPTLIGNANKVVVVNSGETALTATSTVTGVTFSNPTITGGTIDNTVIGGTTPAAGTFTAITGTSAAVNGNAMITGSATVGGSNVVTESASQTLTNKTFNLANNTFVATSAQLAAAITDESGSGALLFANSPAMTGTPTAPTAANGTNTTQIATTAFVAAGFAPFASPAFTGTPTAPTAALGTNTTQIATTAFVAGTAFSSALPAQTGNAGKYVTTNGSTASWASVFTSNFQEFTASGTWTKPSGATFVMVEAWGAGGGGGSGRRAAAGICTGGTGGGGGAYAYRLFQATDLPSSISVTIGAGGSGGAAVTTDSTNGNSGTAGGATTFGAFLSAFGGSGGTLGSNSATAGGGGGGVLAGSASSSTGGAPDVGTGFGQAFGGGQSNASAAGIPSGFGGAGGGGVSTAQGFAGGSSYQGGAGGGAGSVIDSSNTYLVAGAGGGITGTSGTGAVGAFYPGVAGAAGVGREGGGGGAASSATAMSVNNQSLAFGNSTFAVTSDTGLIATSANGTSTWTFRASPSGLPTPWILHDGTKFVLFNSNATRCWTTTNFTTYTEVIGLTSGITVQRVRYANGNYFVMGSSGQLWRSTNLLSWTQVTSGNGGIIYDICWSGTNYVCVSTSPPAVRYSSNLSSWSTTAGSTAYYSCESDGAGTVVIQSDSGITQRAQRSTDHGVTFSAVATTLVQASGSRGLLFANSTWLAAAGNSIWSSTDGDTWTSRVSGAVNSMTGFAWDGTTFVAGWLGNSSTITTTAVPAALGTWTDRTVTAVNTAAGAGGAGGSIGGGGGGGGASLNGYNSGAGGAGGNGLVRVYTW